MKTVNEIFIFIFHNKSLKSDSYFSFRALLNLDHSHFKYSNTTCGQWLPCQTMSVHFYLSIYLSVIYITLNPLCCCCCCCCCVASVVSDSVQAHRWQPTRVPSPWDSTGKNTEVGCHFFLQCIKVKSESEVIQSCLTLSNPMDCSLPGSSVHGIFQARILEQVAIAFSEILFRTG